MRSFNFDGQGMIDSAALFVPSPLPHRPTLRYYGGKWLLAPWIISHFPEHRTYVEPFAGAASVLMRKDPSPAEILNDLDTEIVNFFRVLRDATLAAELARQVALTPFSREEFTAAYDSPPPGGWDAVERARRLLVRCYQGHSAMSRVKNRTGFRKTPFRGSGGQSVMADWANYPDSIGAFAARLRPVMLECRPAVQVIEEQDDTRTLFYVDPPYPVSTRSGISWPSDLGRAYAHEMTDDDHRELAATLRAVEGMVVLSGYPCALYDVELYPDWHRVTRPALADGNRDREEVLWLNPACLSRQTTPEFFWRG